MTTIEFINLHLTEAQANLNLARMKNSPVREIKRAEETLYHWYKIQTAIYTLQKIRGRE